MNPVHSSFRDPNGFIFKHEGTIFRAVMPKYNNDYDLLNSSGLYKKLVDQHLMIPHVEEHSVKVDGACKVLKPEQLQWISYPYEWSFGQLKDAALATLKIQELSLAHGMTLKDASAFNIQFHKGKAVFIDTLSFEKYEDGKPWIAYKQFIQHFLAPLCLMHSKDLRLNQMSKLFIDGIPLDIASSLLPKKTKLSPTLLMHIHLHAKFQNKYSQSGVSKNKTQKLPKTNFLGIIDQLKGYIQKLELPKVKTEWGDYYTFTNYNEVAFEKKSEIIRAMGEKVKPKSVWDLGANQGHFSRIFSLQNIPTVAWDIDPIAVEKNYRQIRKDKESTILPLVLDLINPTPGIGWANQERFSLSDRGPVDLVMALALIHHLSISNNVPLEKVAEYLKSIANHLIIEFVPKEDSQVKILLSSREDIFDKYNLEGFEKAFQQYFEIITKTVIPETFRTLYLMKAK